VTKEGNIKADERNVPAETIKEEEEELLRSTKA